MLCHYPNLLDIQEELVSSSYSCTTCSFCFLINFYSYSIVYVVIDLYFSFLCLSDDFAFWFLLLIQQVYTFAVFVASIRDGISDANNITCHEAPSTNLFSVVSRAFILIDVLLLIKCTLFPGKITKVLAVLESLRPSHGSSSRNSFCKDIPSIIHFFGENHIDRCTFVFVTPAVVVILIQEKLEGYTC